MNEITRIHIAKTAYDIEIAAKKQLEKYIKSLETYTQDADVLVDIEIRITELLAERGVAAGGVIGSKDVSAVRKQLGEPYEFADDEGDIAVGPDEDATSRRLYRSTDDAVLGGVLSGVATYFNVNPLWTRLVFILLLVISFGSAALAYLLFWIVIPPARTATEKLKLAGKDVTLESIRGLNSEEETVRQNRLAPALQQILTISFGSISLLSAVGIFVAVLWIVIAAFAFDPRFVDITNGFTGLGDGSAWIVWTVFWIFVFGMVLLASLFGLMAYAFFTRKLTKKIVISGVVIVVLGITSVAAVTGISATQSWRVASESRSLVRETNVNLAKDFSAVKTVTFDVVSEKSSSNPKYPDFFGNNASIRYVVDEGTPRYELSALPAAKPSIVIDGTNATVSLTIPESFRNSFVQPILTVYGPALESITNKNRDVGYAALSQDNLTVISDGNNNSTTVSGAFAKVIVQGDGSVDLGSSAIQTLDVQSEYNLRVTAGTVRELIVIQPEVCPTGTYQDNTAVTVSEVLSKQISYNGVLIPAESHRTSCAVVVIEPEDTYEY